MKRMKTIAEQLNVKEFPYTIKDKNGNKIYYEVSPGCWIKLEFDSKGNRIYLEDSYGFWIKTEYDSKGNVIKQINFDIHFSYSLDQLRADFISDFQIDIFDSHQKCSVTRESDIDPFPYYQITQPLEIGKLRFFFVNGITGKIVKDELIFEEY